MSGYRSCNTGLSVLLIVALQIGVTAPVEAFGHRVCCPTSTCSTFYQVGSDPDDLKIQVSGARFNKLEAYFRDEVQTWTIDQALNLHCHDQIVLAPESDFGAFAVRYGACDGTVQLFAWKKGGVGAVTLTPSRAVSLSSSAPVYVQWITTRTARITVANSPDPLMIVRFSDADVAWQRFDEPSQSWLPL